MDETHLDFSEDMDEVVSLSNDLIQLMEDEAVPVGLGAAAAALTLARLVSARKLSYEEGEKFITSMVAFATHTFDEGSVN